MKCKARITYKISQHWRQGLRACKNWLSVYSLYYVLRYYADTAFLYLAIYYYSL